MEATTAKPSAGPYFELYTNEPFRSERGLLAISGTVEELAHAIGDYGIAESDVAYIQPDEYKNRPNH